MGRSSSRCRRDTTFVFHVASDSSAVQGHHRRATRRAYACTCLIEMLCRVPVRLLPCDMTSMHDGSMVRSRLLCARTKQAPGRGCWLSLAPPGGGKERLPDESMLDKTRVCTLSPHSRRRGTLRAWLVVLTLSICLNCCPRTLALNLSSATVTVTRDFAMSVSWLLR